MCAPPPFVCRVELFLSPQFVSTIITDLVVEGIEILRNCCNFETFDHADLKAEGIEELQNCCFFSTFGSVARDPRVGPAWGNGPGTRQDHMFRVLFSLNPPCIGRESERKWRFSTRPPYVCTCLGEGSGAQGPSKKDTNIFKNHKKTAKKISPSRKWRTCPRSI